MKEKGSSEEPVAFIKSDPLTLQSILRQMSDNNVPEQEREDVYVRTLEQHILQKLYGYEAHRLGLVIPDILLRNSIRSLPFLHTDKGTFDSDKLQTLLTNGSLQKETLLLYTHSLLMQRKMNSLFFSDCHMPAHISMRLFDQMATTMDTTWYPIDALSTQERIAMEKSVFSSQEFKDFVAKKRSEATVRFVPGLSIPHRRVLHVLHVSKHYFELPSVTEEELKEAVEVRFLPLDEYSVMQLEATSKEDVEKALKALKAGDPLPKGVQSIFTQSLQNNMPDWAKPALSLKEKENSEVTKSDDGVHFQVVYVQGIKHIENKPTSKQELANLRKEIALSKQQLAADQMRLQLEERLTDEASLRQEAKGNKHVRFIEMKPIDRNGLTASGLSTEHMYSVPLDHEATETIFMSSSQQMEPPLTLNDGSHLFFVVQNVMPETTVSDTEEDLSLLIAEFAYIKIQAALHEKIKSISEDLKKRNISDPRQAGFDTKPRTINDISLLRSSLNADMELLEIAALNPGEHAPLLLKAHPLHSFIVVLHAKHKPSLATHAETYKKFKAWLESSFSSEQKRAWGKSLYSEHDVKIVTPHLPENADK